MAVHNGDISSLFNRLDDLLEIEGANAFRVRAYRRAAQMIEDLPVDAAEMIAKSDDLSKLPSIGEDLAAKIGEIVSTGRLKLLKEAAGAHAFEAGRAHDLGGVGAQARACAA
jgi:DNA polymerase (family 10)